MRCSTEGLSRLPARLLIRERPLMTFIDTDTSAGERREHPVDVVERLAAINEWAFDRAETDEISILVSGKFANYDVAFTWLPDMESLHVSCSFDLKTPAHKRAAIGELTQLINEQLWLGHFDQWSQQDTVMFRHALCLAGARAPTTRNASPWSRRLSTPARLIIRRSSSSCGPIGSRARRWRSPRSRPAEWPEDAGRGAGAWARLRVRAAPSHSGP